MTRNKSPGDVASSYAILVLALSVGVVFLNLGGLPLASLNEARRALPIREMFQSGDWLIPTLNGEWYIVKPPFYYWIAAALATAIGTVNEWVVRFPAAVAGLLTLALCYRAVIRYASPWAAIFAVQILIANSGFAVHARRAELEGLLTLFCFASLLCAWRYLEEGAARTWGVASYALLGCAVMTKGPVSLLFVTLPLLVYAFVHQDARGKKLLRDPLGWLILLLVALPWYGLITERIGFDAWQPILKRDIVQKISGHVESEPFYSYLQWIAGAFFPVLLLLFWKPRETIAGWWKNRTECLWLLSFVLPVIVFTLFKEKHAKYLLPAYPCLAMLLATRLAAYRELAGPRVRRVVEWAGPVLGFCFLGYFAWGEERYFAQRYQVLPEIQRFMAPQPAQLPLFSEKNFDVRAIYYIGRTVKELPDSDLKARYQASAQGLFFFEELPKEWQPSRSCLLSDFDPFIRKGQHVFVYRNGSDCTPASMAPTSGGSPLPRNPSAAELRS
jgi:4-amino-4-deoxy-L-arabinose transferase-like glycosyltransferase